MDTTTSQWQHELAAAVRDPLTLLRMLELEQEGKEVEEEAAEAAQQFRLLAPHSYIARMRKGDWHDPLLRQVLPLSDEIQAMEGFSHDPVNDRQAIMADGLLHKYHGRVLLVTTGACAIHCRYCFRRHFPYSESNPLTNEWESALNYIRNNPEVREIILSGGDPLTLSDERLASLFRQLREFPQIIRIRFHSRLPVVLPSRIDDNFITLLQQLPQQIVMVIHTNHAQELEADDVREALAKLHTAGVSLLNQAVLLRGINDNAATLETLSESLFAQRVMPYYLNLLDRVTGAAHFEVPLAEATQLMEQVRARLPGFLVPKLVQDINGTTAKTLFV